MATLAQLKQIQIDSTSTAAASEGSPAPDEVLAAIALLGKIEVALWKEIYQRLAGTDPTFPPGTPIEDQNKARNEAIGWGQSSLPNTAAIAGQAMKVFLAFRATETVGDILASSDALIEQTMNALVPRLSSGFFPGRR